MIKKEIIIKELKKIISNTLSVPLNKIDLNTSMSNNSK